MSDMARKWSQDRIEILVPDAFTFELSLLYYRDSTITTMDSGAKVLTFTDRLIPIHCRDTIVCTKWGHNKVGFLTKKYPLSANYFCIALWKFKLERFFRWKCKCTRPFQLNRVMDCNSRLTSLPNELSLLKLASSCSILSPISSKVE